MKVVCMSGSLFQRSAYEMIECLLVSFSNISSLPWKRYYITIFTHIEKTLHSCDLNLILILDILDPPHQSNIQIYF